MRTLTVFAAILLTGGTVCDAAPPTISSHPEGDSFTAGVMTDTDEVQKCYLETPSNEIIEFQPFDTSGDKYTFNPIENALCRVLIKDLNQNDNGKWTIYFESTSGTKSSASYNITVIPSTTTTPSTTITTITESEERVKYLETENINTSIGSSHTFIVTDVGFFISNRCMLQTPRGQIIDLENINLPDIVKVLSHHDGRCEINISVNSEEAAGDWVLISAGFYYAKPMERRLPFTISIEATSTTPSTAISTKATLIVNILPSKIIHTSFGSNHTFFISNNGLVATDGCMLRTPKGRKIDFKSPDLPDTVQVISRPGSGCAINIFVESQDVVGDWMLISKGTIYFVGKLTRSETRLPFRINTEGCTSCNNGPPIIKSLPIGGEFIAGVITQLYEVDRCYLITPSFEVIDFKPRDLSGDRYNFIPRKFIKCRVLIKDLNQNDNGIWTIYFKTPSGITEEQSYNITVILPSTTSTTPSTAISTKATLIVNILPSKIIHTSFGSNHTFFISNNGLVATDGCMLQTPKGRKIDFKSPDLPDTVQVISRPGSGCAINIYVESQDVVGDWMLISKGTIYFVGKLTRSETRLPFRINTEGCTSCNNGPPIIKSLPIGGEFIAGVITQLYEVDRCYLITPSFEVIDFKPRDLSGDRYNFIPRKFIKCRVLIKDLNQNDNGIWTIYFRTPSGITEKQSYNITVILPSTTSTTPSTAISTKATLIVNILPSKIIHTSFGSNHTFFISNNGLVATDGCMLQTPKGRKIDFKSPDLPDTVQVISRPGSGCAINIYVESQDVVGDWMLISKGTIYFVGKLTRSETRLPFRINTEGCTSCNNGPPIIKSLPIGGEFIAGVITQLYEVDRCYLITPSFEVIDFKPRDLSGDRYNFIPRKFIKCRVLIKDLNQNDNGIWTIYFKTPSGITEEQSYNITVILPSTTSTTPSTAISTKATLIVNILPSKIIHTSFGSNHTFFISNNGLVATDGCMLQTPKGRKIDLKSPDLPDTVQVISRPGSGCAINIFVESQDVVGDWMLISKGTIYFVGKLTRSETRLPFRINTEGCTSCNNGPPIIKSLPIGGEFIAGVITQLYEVDRCYLITPSFEVIDFKPRDLSGDRYNFIPRKFIKCRVLIKDLNQNDNGIWTIYFKTPSGITEEQSYNITVILPSTTSTTPSTAISTNTESELIVDILPTENINTSFGSNHNFIIRDDGIVTSDRCMLQTPKGRKIDLKSPDLPDTVQVISRPGSGCAINIFVKSEDVAGDWMLISEGTRYFLGKLTRSETRLPFTIRIEEKVDASIDEVTLAEGNDFYIRLKNSIPKSEPCRLVGPNGPRKFENDERFSNRCGFIVKEVTKADRGTWKIQYGNKILYTASVVLNVKGNSSGELSFFAWHRDDHINITLGPENAVYCRLESPTGRVVFDSFGRCRAVIDRVTMEHDGDWKMNIGVPSGVFTETHMIVVRVVERAHETPALTNVAADKPIMFLTCKVTSNYPLKSCKFRNSNGDILLATEGVGQGRFSFHGDGSRYINGVYYHECGFQITNPIVRDLGFWRCALETEEAVHYGFLKVMIPWLMRDPEVVAAINTEPSLYSSDVSSPSGSGVTMRCSATAPLRYCYFRSRNGTVINVDPTSPMYEGGGFPSGECGFSLSSLQVADSGIWSCHVGIDKENKKNLMEELRTSIKVSIYDELFPPDLMVTRAQLVPSGLWLMAQVHEALPLEYCRFIRSDGFGFTTAIYNQRYFDRSDLMNGRCGLRVITPDLIERGPWTVVARIAGGNEIARTASITSDPTVNPITSYSFSSIWVIMFVTGIILIIISAIVTPKKNREWVRNRASTLRNSFMRKPPPANNINSTACAA